MAKRQVFFSFHYSNDAWRASQVRNMGVVESQPIYSDNGWEKVRLKSEPAIAAWIASEMKMRSCIVVLIGKETASRKWVKYEIEKAWKDGKGIVGIYIHGLENSSREQSQKGSNPFDRFYVDKTINYIAERTTPADQNDVKLSSVCKAYDPPYITSKCVYDYIKQNIKDWIEEAIEIRKKYPE